MRNKKNKIIQGSILNHKKYGSGFVSKCKYGIDGSISMLIDFNDGMGRRNIMVSDQEEFNRFFKGN